MKMKFLCAKHRNELFENPDRTINLWQNAFDTGHFLHSNQRWHEATPQLGCAFETAEILLSIKALDEVSAQELFTASASLLMCNFSRMELHEHCADVHLAATDRLQQELRNGKNAHEDILFKNLNHLNRYIRCLEEYREEHNNNAVQDINNTPTLSVVH